MAALQWNDHVRFVVTEMSWKQQLACSVEFKAWLDSDAGLQDPFSKQVAIATMLLLYSRVQVYFDGGLLPDGKHTLGEGVVLTLPLTKDSVEDLPGSIVQFLIRAAQEENPTAIANFTEGLMAMTANLSARL